MAKKKSTSDKTSTTEKPAPKERRFLRPLPPDDPIYQMGYIVGWRPVRRKPKNDDES